MILLDQRSYDLLQYLIHLEQPETIMTISKQLGQSRRKIYYHLEKINEALPSGVPPIISIQRVGIVLDDQQKAACNKILASIDSYNYVMSVSERVKLTTLYICISQKRVTIEQMMQLTEVSRNTILNDLNDVRAKLREESYMIDLCFTKRRGYFIQCHPLHKVQYVYALLDSMLSEEKAHVVDLFQVKIRSMLADEVLLGNTVQSYLQKKVKFIEQKLGKTINRYDVSFMLRALPYILLSYQNMALSSQEQAELMNQFHLVKQRMEFKVAHLLSQDLLADVRIQLDDVGVALIAILLLSFRKDKDMHALSGDFKDIQQTIESFVEQFEVSSHVALEHREDLVRNLVTHTKSLLFRKTYGILSRNPLTRKIQAQYRTIFVLTKACCAVLEKAWDIQMLDDDIAYLTVHFGGHLRNQRPANMKQRNIYLVCDEGVAMQRLLLKQCQEHFPDVEIKAVFTTAQLMSVTDLLEADVIISTSHALEIEAPVIHVNPIMEYDDLLHVKRFIERKSRDESGVSFNKALDDLLGQYIDDKQKQTELKYRIQSLINQQIL